jgi:hypothetical protein
MIIQALIYTFILIGIISIGTANGYFNQAFWRSEELWLDEDDFDEDVDRWLRYGNIAYKTCIVSFIVAGILGCVYWCVY